MEPFNAALEGLPTPEHDWAARLHELARLQHAKMDTTGEVLGGIAASHRSLEAGGVIAVRRASRCFATPVIDLGALLFALLDIARFRDGRRHPVPKQSVPERVACLAVVGVDHGIIGRFEGVADAELAWELLALHIPGLIEQGFQAASSPRAAEEFELLAEEAAAATTMFLTLEGGDSKDQ